MLENSSVHEAGLSVQDQRIADRGSSVLIEKVFGPPGTGKTTYLLNVVEQELSGGTDPKKIGYFSFTRKASYEARDRAMSKFPFLNMKTDFPYFRTLHSLAFHVLGTRSEDMMKPEHYREFAQECGIEINVSAADDVPSAKADNPILNQINLARIRGVDLHKHYNDSNLDIEWHHFEFVERSYRQYKYKNYLLDFTDLLELVALEPHRLPSLDAVIVDEAQDLSTLQWKIVEELASRSKRLYIAGDDDQALFTWAGADVNSFINFQGKVRILDKSYRVPSAVHELAKNIVERIKTRQPKSWESRDFAGQVSFYHDIQDIDMSSGEWLVLASTNYLLDPVHGMLKGSGLLFERNHIPSIHPSTARSIIEWERLRKGGKIPGDAVVALYKLLDSSSVARGHKTFKNGDVDGLYTAADLAAEHGLKFDPQDLPIWHEALVKIPSDKVQYIIAMLRRGTRITDPARIRLSTIHGAKGGECDNVVLLLDLSPLFAKEYARNADDVNRLFYVGVTRTKRHLHLIMPKHSEKGFRL